MDGLVMFVGGFSGHVSRRGGVAWERPKRVVSLASRSVEAAEAGTKVDRTLDVVLCHVTADYDTLAAAVGLAKLRGGNAVVVLSGGSNPSVERFLGLFRPMFPVRSPKGVNPRHIRWMGVVDCSRKDRLGKCAEWVEHAESVEVYDHHIDHDQFDLVNENNNIKLVEENVGAATTIIVEKLRDANVHISSGEATLMALGIHSDTGSFTFDNTRPRDARALAWLLEHGANMKAVLEFKSVDLSNEHRDILNAGLRSLKREDISGLTFAHCYLERVDFIKGLSPVAQNLIELTEIDILVFTVVNDIISKQKDHPDRKQLSIIGRCRPSITQVDLGEVFSRWGGGGHAKAAALTIKTEKGAEHAFEDIIEAVREEIESASPS